MNKDAEDRFIARCRADFHGLSFESEALLRYAYSVGRSEGEAVAFSAGVDAQRSQVLESLGASPAPDVAGRP